MFSDSAGFIKIEPEGPDADDSSDNMDDFHLNT